MILSVLFLCLISSTGCFNFTAELEKITTTLAESVEESQNDFDMIQFLKCEACKRVVGVLKIAVYTGFSNAEIFWGIKSIVCLFLELPDVDPEVCRGIAVEFQDEILTVARHLNFNGPWLCYIALGATCGEPPKNFTAWNVTIPGNKPTPEPLVRPKEGLPTLKVVQLSDVHVDLEYTPGSKKKCGKPLCCRDDDGGDEDAAGFWGSLNAKCDIPMWTYENALQFISENIDPDLIFWTGDIPAHDVWDQSRDDQLHRINVTANVISQYFPNTKVYPCLGNHESAPVDSFPPPGMNPEKYSNDWLNRFVEKVWARWLPSESLDTIGYAGYYAVNYTDQLRIISLNTQYCDHLNFWLYVNNTDPGNMLQWLVSELSWAEAAGVKVIILGHIPTSIDDCLKTFSWNYYRIIDRFEATVVGQYMGHTHVDDLSIMRSEELDHHPTGFQFIAPALTTYVNYRPSFRVYILDGVHEQSTYRPLKSETWLFDLNRANEENETVWELEYDSERAYNLTWLTPATMQQLYERFAHDRQFFDDKFWKFKYRDSLPASQCDQTCYRSNLCEMTTGRSYDDEPKVCQPISFGERQKYSQFVLLPLLTLLMFY